MSGSISPASSAASAPPAPSVVRVSPGAPPPRWELRVPGSKSLTNRALLLAGVADGRSRLRGPLVADDTEVMAAVLRALGARVTTVDGSDGPDLVVDGIRGAPSGSADVYCGMAGTVGRFIVPMLAAGSGRCWRRSGPRGR